MSAALICAFSFKYLMDFDLLVIKRLISVWKYGKNEPRPGDGPGVTADVSSTITAPTKTEDTDA
ncbi:hypothetical protein KF913_19455 [Candidatus Obscuribacterales bacterium]|nr:hypothetical protein [Candidatus Obscuribacterales bacterium]